MNLVRICTSPNRGLRRISLFTITLALHAVAAHAHHLDDGASSKATRVEVRLTEWKVDLQPASVPPGEVIFHVVNAGDVPHAFEVEGHGLEKSTPEIKPGAETLLEVAFPGDASGKAASYEVYCPVGKNSHRMLGMVNHLVVAKPGNEPAAGMADRMGDGMAAGMGDAHTDDDDHDANHAAGGGALRITGGGPVIQILPGPYPFADSAMAVIRSRPADQQKDLLKKAELGPYSNNVASIRGDISVVAMDHGATGDSVNGTASFTTRDGARWRLVMDRVQTKDIPFNPRFGGVIRGLFYHGASGVHTPLVPTIQSSLALWAVAHLYRDDHLVTDNAMVHIMLLSRTRRSADWALDCWDCSGRPIEELQLQVTPPPGEPPFAAPGGFLFVNWEKSAGEPDGADTGVMGARPGSPGDGKGVGGRKP